MRFSGSYVDRFAEWAGVATLSGLFLRDGVQLVAIGVTVLLLYALRPARKLKRRGALAGRDSHRSRHLGRDEGALRRLLDFSRYNLIYGSLAGVMTFLFFVLRRRVDPASGSEFAYAWSQPAGPPGPPVRARIIGVVRGLFVHHDEGPAADQRRAGSFLP